MHPQFGMMQYGDFGNYAQTYDYKLLDESKLWFLLQFILPIFIQ